MEKPKTKLEKKACAMAVEDAVKATIEAKKGEYEGAMIQFIDAEGRARKYRAEADELKEKLGITDAQMKELF